MHSLYTLSLITLIAASARAGTAVELLLVPESRAPIGAMQDWARSLSRLKDVRVRSASSARGTPTVERRGERVYVTAVIGRDNQLIVPGRKFTQRQIAALRAWVEAQRSGGASQSQSGGERFGLTAQQLQKSTTY